MSPQVTLPATVTNELFLADQPRSKAVCIPAIPIPGMSEAHWNWVEGPKAMSWDVQAFRWQNKAGFASFVPLSALQASHLTCSDSGPPPN